MRSLAWMLPLSAALCLLAGCGESQQAAQSNKAAAGALATTEARASLPLASASADLNPAGSLPDRIVARFYEALRKGDNALIETLLTDRAREETAQSGLAIQSQASRSLSYEIGETDYVTENLDGAHVASRWAEPEADGSVVSTEVIWVLRKQQDGWKISGMAAAVEDGELPLLFNFENPADMMQKKSYVERRLAEQQEQGFGESAMMDESAESVPPADTPTATPDQASLTETQRGASVTDLR